MRNFVFNIMFLILRGIVLTKASVKWTLRNGFQQHTVKWELSGHKQIIKCDNIDIALLIVNNLRMLNSYNIQQINMTEERYKTQLYQK